MRRNPPDILITTPESLYLMLTSERPGDAGDGGDRDRRRDPRGRRHQARRPPGAVAGAAGRDRPRRPAADRPVGHAAAAGRDRPLPGRRPRGRDRRRRRSARSSTSRCWCRSRTCASWARRRPSRASRGRRSGRRIYPRLLELVREHRSTIVFVNNRRSAERVANRLNELAEQEVARAHHGSIAREQRLEIEEMLKSGNLPALVATSSLELGIDMGAVDLVVQIESPKSVAAGLQRVGRAGHEVGEASRGRFFPKYRGDLLETAVVTGGCCEGAIEHTRVPRQPLDVLAQQVVAATAMDEWRGGRPARRWCAAPTPTATCRASSSRACWRCWPAATPSTSSPSCGRGSSGTGSPAPSAAATAPAAGRRLGRHHPRPRPVRRVPGRLRRPRRRARRGDGVRGAAGRDVPAGRDLLADRGDHPRPGAGLAGARRARQDAVLEGRRPRPALRAGRGRGRGRAHRAGSASWTSARPSTWPPTWTTSGRPPASCPTTARSSSSGSATSWATGAVCVLSPFGGRVHAPWAMAIEARMSERARHRGGGDCGRTTASPCGCPTPTRPPPIDLVRDRRPTSSRTWCSSGSRSSPLFAGRFRENAARALLLPRRRPGQRTPLWQQRLKAHDLQQVAVKYGSFPIVLETYREVLSDVFELPALRELLARARPRRGAAWSRSSPTRPSPFATLAAVRLHRHLHVRGRRARWPSGGRRRSRSTGRCWPSCCRPTTCASCSTPSAIAEVEGELQRRRARARRRRTSCTTCCAGWATSTPRRPVPRPRSWCASGGRCEVRVAGRRAADRCRGRRPLPRRRRRPVPPGVPAAYLEPVPDALERLVRATPAATGRSPPTSCASGWASTRPRRWQSLAGRGELCRGCLPAGRSGREWVDARRAAPRAAAHAGAPAAGRWSRSSRGAGSVPARPGRESAATSAAAPTGCAR